MSDNKKEYRKLDFSKLTFSDKTMSSSEALKDVIPFEWSDEVLSGEKELIIRKGGKNIV